REVRQAEQPRERLDVADLRVNLLGADDGARHDRHAAAQRGRDEAARPNRCSLYRDENGLPIPLKPSGKTPTSSPSFSRRSASALHAGVCPTLRANGPTNGSLKTRSAARCRACLPDASCTATDAISASRGIA